MRILIAAVGRSRADHFRALYQFYVDRLAWQVTLKEIELRRSSSAESAKARESELLLAAVPTGTTIVALDGRGQTFSSMHFAERLAQWRDAARPPSFLIGGADGHGDGVLERADLLLSFGAMTWPHMLIRGMLVEQLYRAQTILSGHPYHRE